MKLDKFTKEQIDDLLTEARKAKRALRTPEETAARKEKSATRKERAKANQPRLAPRKRKGKKVSNMLAPTTEPKQLLAQLKKTFGLVWGDNESNPAVEVTASESHLSARINTYSERRWASRRIGDDNVIVVVKLTDGTDETRRFTRSVLSASWKRSQHS